MFERIYAVECRNNAVKYNMILHISLQELRQIINQKLNPQKTSPWRASDGGVFREYFGTKRPRYNGTALYFSAEEKEANQNHDHVLWNILRNCNWCTQRIICLGQQVLLIPLLWRYPCVPNKVLLNPGLCWRNWYLLSDGL